MRKVIVTEFMTLDGVMENPSSWQKDCPDVDDGPFKAEELFASSALLLGRITYEEFISYWPTATETGAFGQRMNDLPKFVATTTLNSLEWNATALEGDVAEAVTALKQQGGGDILTYGSATLTQTLLRHGLVDELRLQVYPLAVGQGKRLFSAEEVRVTEGAQASATTGKDANAAGPQGASADAAKESANEGAPQQGGRRRHRQAQ